MDTSYYFVLDADGTDDGPYRLTEIQRRIHIGLLSRQVTLCKCGETAYVPVTDPRYAEVLEPPPEPKPAPKPEPKLELKRELITPPAEPTPEPRRTAAGTTPPPVAEPEAISWVAQPAATMSAQPSMTMMASPAPAPLPPPAPIAPPPPAEAATPAAQHATVMMPPAIPQAAPHAPTMMPFAQAAPQAPTAMPFAQAAPQAPMPFAQAAPQAPTVTPFAPAPLPPGWTMMMPPPGTAVPPPPTGMAASSPIAEPTATPVSPPPGPAPSTTVMLSPPPAPVAPTAGTTMLSPPPVAPTVQTAPPPLPEKRTAASRLAKLKAEPIKPIAHKAAPADELRARAEALFDSSPSLPPTAQPSASPIAHVANAIGQQPNAQPSSTNTHLAPPPSAAPDGQLATSHTVLSSTAPSTASSPQFAMPNAPLPTNPPPFASNTQREQFAMPNAPLPTNPPPFASNAQREQFAMPNAPLPANPPPFASNAQREQFAMPGTSKPNAAGHPEQPFAPTSSPAISMPSTALPTHSDRPASSQSPSPFAMPNAAPTNAQLAMPSMALPTHSDRPASQPPSPFAMPNAALPTAHAGRPIASSPAIPSAPPPGIARVAQTQMIAPPSAHADALAATAFPPDAPPQMAPPAVAVLPRGFVPQPSRPAPEAPVFVDVAEGSGAAPMPMPPHQPLALPPPSMSHDQLAMQVYDPGYDHAPHDATQAQPRVAFAWWKQPRVLLIAGGSFAVLLTIILAVALTRGGSTSTKDAMVRVSTPSATGAGFFIAGPDKYAYVVTANHIVDRGERVLIERDVGEEKQAFVEAYPETEIVAADADADLAIIRIKNVDASRFPQLPLADAPLKDERILSFGYPGSSLATKTGLVSKDGKVLSLVSFPAYDERYRAVLRDNAVDGVLVSTDIEPGMSGGPTTNDSGEVIGVNVTKDRAHVGQNGAVSVVALRKLADTIKPAVARAQPTTDDVAKLLEKIQSEYLVLPIDERKKIRETDFVSAGDLPALRQLVNEVRREERNTDNSFIAKYRLSGQAALGIFFARLPGKLLETYRAPSTIAPIVSCELANQRLTSFLGDLSPTDKRVDAPRASTTSCDELAVRPLAWDLVAATLQWEGKEQRYSVTKLDKMDEDGKIYRASVRIAGAPNLVELWIGMDQGAARLKLFDPAGSLYAIKSPRNVPASVFQGTWSMKRPRVTDAINKEAEVESSELVSISIEDGKVSIRHVITERYFGAGNRARAFACNGRRTIETGLLQSFTGTLENGVVVALPDKEAEVVGADAPYCRPLRKADRIVAIKQAGDQLFMYRTDGNAYPEALQLTRDIAATVPAAQPPSPQ